MLKKRILIVKLLIMLLNIILIVILISRTLAKYEVVSTTKADIQAAFYLMKEDYQSLSIRLSALEPRNEAYEYTFSVSNNDGEKITETTLEYDLRIVTTTNIQPLTYELYLNEGTENIFVEDIIQPDEYGTYFRTFTTPKETFEHSKKQTNIYTLVVKFPITYKQPIYQDLIESIEIQINSRQLIESSNTG